MSRWVVALCHIRLRSFDLALPYPGKTTKAYTIVFGINSHAPPLDKALLCRHLCARAVPEGAGQPASSPAS